jgi:hypothetical protein
MVRFSIRDVLLTTAIVSLCVGWWLDRRTLAKEMRDIEARAELWEYRADSVSGDGWRIDWTPYGADVSKAAAEME